MQHLLDTVTIVRHFSGVGKVGEKARGVLNDSGNLFIISVISLMEVMYLSRSFICKFNLPSFRQGFGRNPETRWHGFRLGTCRNDERRSGFRPGACRNDERRSGFRPKPCRNDGEVGLHTEHGQIFLLFLTENLTISRGFSVNHSTFEPSTLNLRTLDNIV